MKGMVVSWSLDTLHVLDSADDSLQTYTSVCILLDIFLDLLLNSINCTLMPLVHVVIPLDLSVPWHIHKAGSDNI